MATTITLPSDLDFQSVSKFSLALESVAQDNEYYFDYHALSRVEPFGMLVVGAKMRQFMSRMNARYFASNFEGKQYAAHMGFFKSIGLAFGKEPGEAGGNENYIPITEIKVSDLRSLSAEFGEHVGAIIERRAEQLARVLSRGNDDLKDYLTYSLRELIRNTVEHSQAHSVWVAGQYWPTKDLVEIAILDEGVGIKKGLSRNPNLRMQSTRDALLLSIEPGVSGTYRGKRSRDYGDMWENSGFGLYMTSSLCQRGGSFVMCSGDQALFVGERNHGFADCSFGGTAIRMRLQVSKIRTLSAVTSELVREGERRARSNARASFLSASKVSRLLVTHESESDAG